VSHLIVQVDVTASAPEPRNNWMPLASPIVVTGLAQSTKSRHHEATDNVLVRHSNE